MDTLIVALILAVCGISAGIGTKLAFQRFNRLLSREQERLSREMASSELPDAILERQLQREITALESSTAASYPAAHNERVRDLEVRLAEVHSSQQASQREFAVQSKYHALGLAQAKVRFGLACSFGALGGAVILAGAIKAIFFSPGDSETAVAILTAVSGAIPQALAALLFRSASKADARTAANFDRGRTDRNLATAQQIAANIPEPTLRARVEAALALSMASATIDDAALKLIQSVDESESPAIERPRPLSTPPRSGTSPRLRPAKPDR